MEPLDIREIQRGDIDEIMAIERASFTMPWIETFFKEELELPATRAYRARIENENRLLVGYMVNHLVLDELHILNIAAHPDYRRLKIGTRLFFHCMENNPQVRTVYLEVREHNKAARAFYRKRGFTQVGKRKSYYSDSREDAIIMAWKSA